MKFKIFSILTVFMLIITSCDEIELNEINKNIEDINYDDIKVLNGRLYFPNKLTFQDYYADLREKDENEVAAILQSEFYSKDFYSLKPIVNEQTEELQVRRHLANIRNNSEGLQKRANSNESLLEEIDDLEDVLGEDVFTSFLNQEAELQVADKVYKYTDAGLFISDVNEIHNLNTYLDNKQISRNLLEPTPELERLAYIKEHNPCGGLTSLDEGFQHFIASDSDCLDSDGSSSSGSSSSSSGISHPNGTPNATLAVIANGLDQCSGSKPWIGNLFGTTRVCIDKYEKKKRVKIKYYNINLFLAYVIGIKTKHQKKSWIGFWRKEKTDEVALGVNSLSWKFETPTPPDALLNHQPARIYFDDGRMFTSSNDYLNSVFSGHVPVPNLPFAHKVDAIIEVAINTPWFNNEEDVRKFIYEKLFDKTKDLLKKYRNKQLKKLGVVVVTTNSIWVQFYDFSKSCTNCAKKQNVIDFGIATPTIRYTFGGGNGGSFDITSWTFDFKNPSLTGMSAFGMAKRNGKWHGKRMVF